jgi:hypothetical protein
MSNNEKKEEATETSNSESVAPTTEALIEVRG